MIPNIRIVSILIIFLMTSCATLIGGKTYTAHVVALDQDDVMLRVNDRLQGKGSVIFEHKRKQPLTVIIDKPDCQPYEEKFRIDTRGFLVGCDVISIVGLVIDFGTGAIYRPEYRQDVRVDRINYDTYKFTIFNQPCQADDPSSMF